MTIDSIEGQSCAWVEGGARVEVCCFWREREDGGHPRRLDAKRRERGMTWREVAKQMPGFTPSMLTNLAKGPSIGFPRVMTLTQWLGRPAADFVRARSK